MGSIWPASIGEHRSGEDQAINFESNSIEFHKRRIRKCRPDEGENRGRIKKELDTHRRD